MTITLHDFFLGMPLPISTRTETCHVWTVFEDMDLANESDPWSLCEKSCEENLDCLAAFPGRHGCFLAYNNHTHHEAAGCGNEGPVAGNRTLHGKLAGCRLLPSNSDRSTAGQCTAAPILAQHHIIDFGQVQPDWLSGTARLEFSLMLEVGEQEFLSEVGNIDLRQGLPVPMDAVAMLEVPENGLRVNLGNTLVENNHLKIQVMEYDPWEVKSILRLLVMPLLPDRAFDIQWLLPVNASEDLKSFRQAEQCVNSKLVNRRYEVCGAHGPLKDKPVVVAIAPWTGQLQDTLDFHIITKAFDVENQWPPSQRWSVKLQFDGVDSPAAWAVKKYGCKVLDNVGYDMISAVVSSADALCTLISLQCDTVCQLLKRSLGTGESRSVKEASIRLRNQALLSSEGIMKALSCVQHTNSTCAVSSYWDYKSKDNTLALHGFGARMSPEVWVKAIAHLGTEAPQFLKHQRFTEEATPGLTRSLAAAFWALDAPSIEFLQVMANKSHALPEKLLDTMIQMKAGVSFEAAATSLQENFGQVTRLDGNLEDARQLKQVALALKLAPNVKRILLSCKACPSFAREGLLADWLQLFAYFPEMVRIHMDNFDMKGPGFSTAFGEALQKGKTVDCFTLADCTLLDPNGHVAWSIGQMSSLTELDVSSTIIFDDQWPLGTSVVNLTQLRKLHYNNGHPIVAAQLLQFMAEQPPKHLIFLSVEGDGLGDESIETLGKLLPELSGLNNLHLGKNAFTDALAKPLIQSIARLKSPLEFLEVHNNNMTKETETWILSKFHAMRSMGPTGSLTMLDPKRIGKSKIMEDLPRKRQDVKFKKLPGRSSTWG